MSGKPCWNERGRNSRGTEDIDGRLQRRSAKQRQKKLCQRKPGKNFSRQKQPHDTSASCGCINLQNMVIGYRGEHIKSSCVAWQTRLFPARFLPAGQGLGARIHPQKRGGRMKTAKQEGENRREQLRDPERVPYTGRAPQAAEQQRRREISREGPPRPRPSRAPQEITETAETMKPPLMIRRAVAPISTVSALSAKRPISCPGTAQHSTVPKAIIPAASARAVL